LPTLALSRSRGQSLQWDVASAVRLSFATFVCRRHSSQLPPRPKLQTPTRNVDSRRAGSRAGSREWCRSASAPPATRWRSTRRTL
jgi:hypothetical protein